MEDRRAGFSARRPTHHNRPAGPNPSDEGRGRHPANPYHWPSAHPPVAALFHGKPILIEFSPTVRNPAIILASIRGLVWRMEEANASEEVLLIRIHDLVAEYDGLSADLASRTPLAIRLSVWKA